MVSPHWLRGICWAVLANTAWDIARRASVPFELSGMVFVFRAGDQLCICTPFTAVEQPPAGRRDPHRIGNVDCDGGAFRRSEHRRSVFELLGWRGPRRLFV